MGSMRVKLCVPKCVIKVLPDLINLSKAGVVATDEILGSITQVSCVGK